MDLVNVIYIGALLFIFVQESALVILDDLVTFVFQTTNDSYDTELVHSVGNSLLGGISNVMTLATKDSTYKLDEERSDEGNKAKVFFLRHLLIACID